MPNVTVKRFNTLNPASLMHLPTDGEPHDCLAELEMVCTLRPDLTDEPLTNAGFVLYTDGSAFREDTGTNRVGYAVVTDSEVLSSDSLPCHLSAQGAELLALTEACKIAEGKSVTIYTGSRYAFGVHDFGPLWKCRGFLKADGKRVLNHVLIAALLEAILLPSKIAVVKCPAHTNLCDLISQGNARADVAAKVAARRPPPVAAQMMTSSLDEAEASVADMQSLATKQEKAPWHCAGATWDKTVNRVSQNIFSPVCKVDTWVGPRVKSGDVGFGSSILVREGIFCCSTETL